MSQTVQASSIREGLIQSAQNNYEATQIAMTQTLIVESYCHKVLMQTPINFDGASKLKDSEDRINQGLKKAQDNALFYLEELRPKMIKVLVNVRVFAGQMQSVAEAIRRADSMAKILNYIKYPLDSAQKYEQEAENVLDSLKKFEKRVAEDTAFYQGVLDELNALIDGDRELLERYQTQLKEIENKITGSSFLVAGGVLGILGGAFLIAVGTISSFVTAGTSLPIAAVGGALLLGGIGATASGSVALAGLLDEKSALVNSINTVKREAKFAREYVTTFGDLHRGAADSLQVAQNMCHGWYAIEFELKNLYDQLSGTSDISTVQDIVAPSIDRQMNGLISDVTIIIAQMGGVEIQNISVAEQADWTAFAKQKVGVLV
ncbi:MAG: alpha-helical pore-forming toxin family protein [Microcystis aeruginosa LL13-06]|nr:alpha-helical pore-forming toxin family protein [Microcystis aeruginosa LL13-06]